MNQLDVHMSTYILDSIQNRKGVFVYSDPLNNVLISNNN